MNKKAVAIFDVDGVLTDGTFYQKKSGKYMKKFGPDDWDAIRELMKHVHVHFVTADKKGFPIVHKRIVDEMGFWLDLVPNKPPSARWQWIRENYPDEDIIYVGDGIYDWYCLERAHWSFCPSDALKHVRKSAMTIINRRGGNRFVAEVCLEILFRLGVDCRKIGEIDE